MKNSLMAIGMVLIIGSFPIFAGTPSIAMVQAVQNATFEIVVPKQEGVDVKYEKDLPLELIPFAQRQDKFSSIGTCFLIKDNIFITAAHVLGFHYKSLNKDFYIRTENKEVFRIDKILKYASDRDYVVFTVEKGSFKCPLKLNVVPKLNTIVYAAGNALGEGVVIREGLLTSTTFEELDGKWKWLRFSAAASPGNSGGPLLDASGKVIGIVLRKSENENLNFALPIQEVLSDSGQKGISREQVSFGLFNWGEMVTKVFSFEFPLPQTVSQLLAKLPNEFEGFYDQELKKLIVSKSESFFPKSVKPNLILFNPFFKATFPKQLFEDENRFWRYGPSEAEVEKNPVNAILEKNGSINYFDFRANRLAFLRLPDNDSVSEVMGNSKHFMDLMLRGFNLSREFGKERIKVTSLASANATEVFEDNYGRKWMYWEWTFPPLNMILMGISLPTPKGITSLFMYGDISSWANRNMLKQQANFILQDYEGSLKQWDQFLSLHSYLPDFFSEFKLQKKGLSLDIATSYFKVSLDPEILPITEESQLLLGTSFVQNSHSASLNITSLEVRAYDHSENKIEIAQYRKPPEELSPQYSEFWDHLANEKSPFNGSLYAVRSGILSIQKVMPIGSPKKNSVNYTVSVTNEWNKRQDDSIFYRRLDRLSSSLLIYPDIK